MSDRRSPNASPSPARSWRARRSLAAARIAPARVASGRGFRGRRNAYQPSAKLRQPAFAPAVMLAVAEGFAPAFGNAEIELLHVLVLGQRLGVAVHHHPAVLENVAVAREPQRHMGIL